MPEMPESGRPDSSRDDVVAALVQLQCTRAEAESRFEKAWRSLKAQQEAPNASALLREALRDEALGASSRGYERIGQILEQRRRGIEEGHSSTRARSAPCDLRRYRCS